MLLLTLLIWFQGVETGELSLEAALSGDRGGNPTEVFRQFRPDGPRPEDEQLLNRLGYQLLRKGANARAIEVFLLNTKLFPEKAYPYLINRHLYLSMHNASHKGRQSNALAVRAAKLRCAATC